MRHPDFDPDFDPDPHADLRDDAFALFQAEAARVRLHERTGAVRIVMRSGTVLVGRLQPRADDPVIGHLDLVTDDHRRVIAGVEAVVSIAGASAVLRDEPDAGRLMPLSSRLRECWALGEAVRVLLCDGRWITADVVLVAADHVELVVADERWVVPYGAAEAWDLGDPHDQVS